MMATTVMHPVDEQGDVHVDTPVTSEQEKFTITLPDESDAHGSDGVQFLAMLEANKNKRGIKSLMKHYHFHGYHLDQADNHWRAVLKSASVVNGVRTPLQKTGDKGRSLKKTATRFYESLNTAALRMQCTLFNIDYDAYEAQEDIIDALVSKHLEMAQ
jgi:hypothetical protein